MSRLLVAIATALGLVLPARGGSGTNSLWERIGSLPCGNAGCACGVVAGRVMLAGGTCWQGDQKRVFDAVLALDATAGTWREIGRLPNAFSYGAVASFGDSLCVIGGDDGRVTHSDGWGIGVRGASRTWGKLGRPVACCGSAQHDGWLYVLGGAQDFRDWSKASSGFCRLSSSGLDAEPLPEFPAGRVMQPALAIAAKRVFAFGGCFFVAVGQEVQNTRGAWAFDPLAREWKKVAAYPFAARGIAACAVDDNHILLAGGFRDGQTPGSAGDFTAACFLYDAVTGRYYPLPPMPYAASHTALVRQGNHLYLIGGEDRRRHRSAAVHRASAGAIIAAARE